MRYNIKLSTKEKINIWLDLCEFSLVLTEKTLSRRELDSKMESMRNEHLKRDKIILEKVGGLK